MRDNIVRFFDPLYRWLTAYLSACGFLLYGGKGDSPPPPDYTPMANASKEAAEIGAQLGREQLAENRRQYDLNMEVAKPIIDKQSELMNQAKEQGDDYYNYMKSVFRPVEQSLVTDAMYGSDPYSDVQVAPIYKTVKVGPAEVDAKAAGGLASLPGDMVLPRRDMASGGTHQVVTNQAQINAANATNSRNVAVRANIEQEASRAAADVSRANANTLSQTQRTLLSMGVNPNSGKFAAMQSGIDLAGAAAKAGAMTVARQKGVALDYAKRMDAVGVGRNLPGVSQGAYSVALNAGNSAVGNQNGTSAQYMAGVNTGTNTQMQGQGLKIQGLGSILNSQTSAYNASAGSEGQSTGAIIGAAGSIAAAFI